MSKTPLVRLIAIVPKNERAHVYNTRRLVAGDEFEIDRQTADLLIRTGRAKLASSPMPQQAAEPAPVAPPQPVPAPTPEPESVSCETEEDPDEFITLEEPPEPAAVAPNGLPKRPRGRPPIHGRYSRRDL
jgi:hypothetical protein